MWVSGGRPTAPQPRPARLSLQRAAQALAAERSKGDAAARMVASLERELARLNEAAAAADGGGADQRLVQAWKQKLMTQRAEAEALRKGALDRLRAACSLRPCRFACCVVYAAAEAAARAVYDACGARAENEQVKAELAALRQQQQQQQQAPRGGKGKGTRP